MGSRACELNRCGSWALVHRLILVVMHRLVGHGTWDHPGSGIDPVFPALAGVFFEPPGKASVNMFLIIYCKYLMSPLSSVK